MAKAHTRSSKPKPKPRTREAARPRGHRAPRNEPVWWTGVELPERPRLEEDLNVDVAIVGAGISGLTAAYLLSREGRTVAVVDSAGLARGMTGATSAHLATALDRRYADIERVRGREEARLAAESHAAAIDRIERIATDEKISCELARVDGYLFLGEGSEPAELERELAAAGRAGLGVETVARAPLPFETGPCVRFPRQGRFHPLRYVEGLARAIERRGGRLFEKTRADEIRGGADAAVRAGKRTIACGAVIVATNAPVNDLVVIHTKQAPYMTYVVGARIPDGGVPPGLYWDTEDPFHYVRTERMPDGDGDCLIVGGEDHKSGQADDAEERFERLEGWARARFPQMQEVAFTWAGQVMETLDGLAYIGRNPADEENVYVVTGDSGNGLTHGTIAGMLLTDLVLGRPNPWTRLYDPSRIVPAAAADFVKENVNVAAQYAQWATPGEVASIEEIAPDSGALLRRGLHKVAVYKGARGAIRELSPVCPHLGCLVQWNGAEKTWDCPCHGSRFDKVGKVVNGPANRDLGPAES
jgi:glycine/D-amino acid oxidase-like deaminating enzyme/nitrite reductase/ring-hydroxylating ferredoxin subunit